jgi:hypothetical protein
MNDYATAGVATLLLGERCEAEGISWTVRCNSGALAGGKFGSNQFLTASYRCGVSSKRTRVRNSPIAVIRESTDETLQLLRQLESGKIG